LPGFNNNFSDVLDPENLLQLKKIPESEAYDYLTDLAELTAERC
jgi:hypothetical protein